LKQNAPPADAWTSGEARVQKPELQANFPRLQVSRVIMLDLTLSDYLTRGWIR